ncbi:MAG: YMGG-like glycine zipper-containing protein [Pseudomonadota bacterium]
MNTKVLGILAVLAVSACATGGYQPVVDGPRGDKYYSDLQACRSLASQASRQDRSILSGAAVGAAIGGIVGSVDGNLGDGAAAGAGVGAVQGAVRKNNSSNSIVRNCMRNRGHNVVG